jgi:hypothetical protein
MTQLRHVAVAALILAALGGCGESYVVDPARLNVTGMADDSRDQLLKEVSSFLGQEGFEDLGKPEEMIALFQHGSMPETVKEQELDRLTRERTFLNAPHHLRVEFSDYSNGEPPKMALSYAPVSDHFVEINIYDERPGGFSPYGLGFFSRFLATLRQKHGTSLVIVKEPPPTNEAEYRRITVVNAVGAGVGWFIALLVPFLFTGGLSIYLLRKCRFSTPAKRLIFVLINSWLVAPLPFPAASILVIPAPNLLAFPWTDSDFYSRVASYAAVSLPCTLALCALASMFLFRSPSETSASRSKHQRAG